MNRRQIQSILTQLGDMGWPDSHQVMVGVLVSPKSLRREPLKEIWVNKYPDPDELATMFYEDPRALNLVHYNSKEPGLANQLMKVVERTPHIHGFQLNIAWPDPAELRLFKAWYPEQKIVLQVGSKALAELSIGQLLQQLDRYEKLVDYWLLDRSGGLGVPLRVDYTRKVIDFATNKSTSWSPRPAIAGGLTAENLEQKLKRILAVCPGISWDAEGGLRSDDDRLDLGKCRDYLRASAALIRQR